MSEIMSVFKDIAQLNPLFRDQITNFSINQVTPNVFDEPDKLVDFAAALSTGEVRELQDMQSKLSRDVESKITKRQRQYHLMEQLIKKEFGTESDGKDKIIEKFKERAAALKILEAVRKVFDEEIAKLASR
ncbi:hypothetical protein F5887DRAFT_1256717 [Amanita rubescens]|nr:hypothetical protein F5887DRAFT_1256717 [Amanita rubescens]